MTKRKFENDLTNHQKKQTKYSVKGAQDMTIEELIESIRGKIQYVQKKNVRRNNLQDSK